MIPSTTAEFQRPGATLPPALILATTLAITLSIALSACVRGGGRDVAGAPQPTPDTGPVNVRIVNAIPPGQSGFFSLLGQAQGMASGDPADFGEHVDDQRLLYWSFGLKPGGFADVSNLTALEPRTGVQIYRDEFGVPIVYADSLENAGYGTGYALAQDRLFLQDAGRRMARGTLAELTGAGTVPDDIQTRVLTYTEAEYQAMFDALPEAARTITQGFVDGSNAWVQVARTNPLMLPAEYALLTSLPEPFSVTDVMATGVLITRSVASDGGNSFDNVLALRALAAQHGDTAARTIMQDLLWFDDRQAAVTIPLAEGEFSNITTPPSQRSAVFNAMADFALGLPEDLATGDGTGDAAVPGLGLPELPPGTVGFELPRRLKEMFEVGTGASYMMAVSGSRSATGRPLLINGPQLGYGYPGLLMEIEVHGGGIDARGATAPLLPVIGIGYGEATAWGVTTGNSKTIDSFIEVLVPGEPNRYRHNGEIKDMDCRLESINYRQAQMGVPVGPAAFSVEVEICRTVHGPVVARSADGNFARSLQYAMWGREVETVKGVMQWGMVDTFAEFDAAMREVTWNENTMFIGADGTIAYYHPGLHPVRSPLGDQRLPLPGTGEFDHAGMMPFDALPRAINPAQGFIANWNEKPAYGWGEGTGGGNFRPAGSTQRMQNWTDQAAADPQISFDDILAMDREAGIRDQRARSFVPILGRLRGSAELSPRQAALIDAVLGWDQRHYRVGLDIEDETATDTPGATIFDAIVDATIDELFAELLPADLFNRLTAVGNNEHGAPPLYNLATRILDPASSSLTPVFDFTAGRGPQASLLAAIDLASQRLQDQFGSADIASYTRLHHRDEVCSLTGGIIGPCLTMPHQNRGSWNQVVSFE